MIRVLVFATTLLCAEPTVAQVNIRYLDAISPSPETEWLEGAPADVQTDYAVAWPIYVSPQGSDASDGSPECPVRSDARALEVCRAHRCGIIRLPKQEHPAACGAPIS